MESEANSMCLDRLCSVAVCRWGLKARRAGVSGVLRLRADRKKMRWAVCVYVEVEAWIYADCEVKSKNSSGKAEACAKSHDRASNLAYPTPEAGEDIWSLEAEHKYVTLKNICQTTLGGTTTIILGSGSTSDDTWSSLLSVTASSVMTVTVVAISTAISNKNAGGTIGMIFGAGGIES